MKATEWLLEYEDIFFFEPVTGFLIALAKMKNGHGRMELEEWR